MLLKGPLRWYYLSTFLGCLGIGLSLVLYVLYLHEIRHLSVGFATTLLAANAVAALISSPLSGTLTDRIGPFWVIVVLVVIHALALVNRPDYSGGSPAWERGWNHGQQAIRTGEVSV